MPKVRNVTDGDLTALLPGQPPVTVAAGETVDVPDEVYDAAAWPVESWDAPDRRPEPSAEPEVESQPDAETTPPRRRATKK